ncbi:metallophosphoesterase [Mucilaginibacter sp. PPCGB 2223]|uniref:outer membrane protein assembly factor BamB family protein n=1 Tax=Mucilaginibacter sp. PPCGB 2223 TaxID=1886027 RepID=UPI000825609B|nr:PQQ-binding-like beta-propeller repeat protein [Mucilaginibacter sp. PPCGB 2223]OCX52173.1 metallophosphoesterase [Mucilaginibacter sp. PPCGB 2223]
MKNKVFVCLTVLLLITAAGFGQSFKFAFVSDTHIGNATAAEDLRRTVKDINSQHDLKFVVITGDITEFGACTELNLAKQLLDSLHIKWYVIPGNHDSNWSESGSNDFRRIFGAETFAFNYGGYLFAATSSGPNMRMGPGQVPRENVVWLDSVLKSAKPGTPVIYLNHYPQDSSQNNWYTVMDMLKKKNTQLILCGHGHNNHKYNFEGIPGIMGRSNLRAKDSVGGYNIVTFDNGKVMVEERNPITQKMRKWAELKLYDHHFDRDTARYYRPSYAMNDKYGAPKAIWTYQDDSDIGAGMAMNGSKLVLADTKGLIFALNNETGKRLWAYATGGKIYSTPAVSGDKVVVGSSDHDVYCLNINTGKLLWKQQAAGPVLGSAVISNNIAYIGASDGHFRAIDMNTGKLVWDFDRVKGFVVDKPLIYRHTVYFGDWANGLYALDMTSGKLIWQWSNGSSNRMFSAAACYPVAADGRLFIVAPDRYMTALDAADGKVLWRRLDPKIRVRESMGLSADSALVYVKTMDGQVLGVSVKADSMHVAWRAAIQLPYELDPSPIIEDHGAVYIPTHSGIVHAIEAQTGKILWGYKISNSLVNPVQPDGNTVYVSTMDGKICCLRYREKNG